MNDRFYTPSDITEKMLSCVKASSPSSVADFAAGSGELLSAASKRWPNASFVAADIDGQAVRNLRSHHRAWIVSKLDFLDEKNTKKCGALSHAVPGLDLILLNPPFSSRGSSRCKIQVGEMSIWSGRALAFVLNALPYLALTGEMVAVLPAGSLKSEKDQKAWSLIRSAFEVTIVGTNGHRSFDGCFPHTVVVRIARGESVAAHARFEISADIHKSTSLTLYRGRLSMHAVQNEPHDKSIPLIHSTSLIQGRVDLAQFRASNAPYALKGPVILLPRVGEPRRGKVVLHCGNDLMALSDCVIGIKAGRNILRQVHDLLLSNWDEINAMYLGTGAKYITIAELSSLLRLHGYRPKPSKGEGWQFRRAIERTAPELETELIAEWRSFLARNSSECSTSSFKNSDDAGSRPASSKHQRYQPEKQLHTVQLHSEFVIHQL